MDKLEIGSPEVIKWDWENYYKPSIVNLVGFTKFRAFKFEMVNDEVEMFYKENVNRPKWKTVNDGIILFFVSILILLDFMKSN